ncbi:MAG: discoidin domain-containing protein [Cytophagaceae bacterium]|jgi:hypothetical protein|nr:discoidin domain-containing protein [Cytophagaceae bacterium]
MKVIAICLSLLSTYYLSAQFQLNGAATQTGASTYSLTPSMPAQSGAIWQKLQHDLTKPLFLSGQLNFGADANGADGIAFVIQNSCLSAGTSGGGIGFGGIPGQSIAVEFDTYQNILGTGAELNNDPAFDHMALSRNGDVVHDGSPEEIIAPILIDPSLSNVKNGNWFYFEISYDPGTTRFKVDINGISRIDILYDIRNNVFAGHPWVYWGFTSSTGGFHNNHQIQIDAATSTLVLSDTTICSGSIPVQLNPFTSLRGTNLALRNPVVSSPGALQPANRAVDGNMTSRWESAFSDPQWIYVDLQSPTDIDSVVLYWEGAYASGYSIETSTDLVTWTPQFTTTTGNGAKDLIVFSAPKVRYVRMLGTTRGTPYGYSLWEFQVYGQPHYIWSTNNGTESTISPDVNSSSVILSPAVTTTYSVLIPDVCLGFTTASMTVTVDCNPLPVTLLEWNAIRKGNGTQLQWRVEKEEAISHYQIWKSIDGLQFFPVDRMKALNSSAAHSYSLQDNTMQSGTVYYKLVIHEADGSISESELVQVQYDALWNAWLSQEEENMMVNISHQGSETIKAEITLITSTGQILQHLTTNQSVTALSYPGSSGLYFVMVRAAMESKVLRLVR